MVFIHLDIISHLQGINSGYSGIRCIQQGNIQLHKVNFLYRIKRSCTVSKFLFLYRIYIGILEAHLQNILSSLEQLRTQ